MDRTLEIYREHWSDPKIKEEMRSHGLECANDATFPSTENLRFVMLDEFFPMFPTHRNSFCSYIHKYYTGKKQSFSFNIIHHNTVS